jgi:hypothetical protein
MFAGAGHLAAQRALLVKIRLLSPTSFSPA